MQNALTGQNKTKQNIKQNKTTRRNKMNTFGYKMISKKIIGLNIHRKQLKRNAKLTQRDKTVRRHKLT